MSLNVKEQYFGFEVKEKHFIKEIKSMGYILEHKKSGAKMMYLANDDDNKVFSATFRTPPPDNTGLPHILEHSVLCGSRKFPVKEPFVELLKGSLNTFLNAMTFSDKTMYPVASRNNKDFLNLMDVYLDAVFYPNIHEEPEILMQEGWHYDIESVDKPIRYKGVVYNEMKGAFSSPEEILARYCERSLFPETPYSMESGGDPDFITNLTQEAFLDFHKKYYHPGNSFLFLYGDMNVLDVLAFINENYLKDFECKNLIDSKITKQVSFKERKKDVLDYPIAKSASGEKNTFLSLNYVIGDNLDGELCLAFDILTRILLNMQGAPLKEALLKAGIGQDISGSYHSEVLQPYLTIQAIKAEENDNERFVEIIEDTLKQLVKEGIDKRKIQAAINCTEFSLREANFGNYPKGLIYHIKSMNSWLHDGNAFLHLEYERYLENIKKALETDYFESLIQKYLLTNKHSSLVIVRPKAGLEEESNQKIKEKLANFKKSLNDTELNALLEQTKTLLKRQNAIDSLENLEKIKLLQIADIEKETQKLPLEESESEQIKTLWFDDFTNNIVYFRAYFDTSDVSFEDVPYLYLMAYFLGKIDTKEYSYSDLDNEIDIFTGGISFECKIMSKCDDDSVLYPKFLMKTKALAGNVEKMFALLLEIASNSKFVFSERFSQLLDEYFARLEMEMLENGRQVALLRALSYFSPLGAYQEQSSLSLYHFLKKENLLSRAGREKIAEKLSKLSKKIFNKKNVVVNVMTEKQYFKDIEKKMTVFFSGFSQMEKIKQNYNFESKVKNEGLLTVSKVQYVLKAANFKKIGYEYSGSMKVLETILRFEYFWHKIRVQGGAYGAFLAFMRNGLMYFGSYRDPNLKETINVFDEAGDFLRKFSATEREMTKYIIGTISQLDMPLTPQMKGDKATLHWFQKRSFADLQKERTEILQTTVEDVRKLADLVERAMQENFLCVYGNNEKIQENAVCFKNLVSVV